MKLQQLVIPALFFLIFSGPACQPSDADGPVGPSFFDIKGYFEGEIQRLRNNQQLANKYLEVNNSSEQLEGVELDYEKELSSFLKADINKVSWQEKYQADTLLSGEGRPEQITYKALDPDLRTQSVQINFKEEQVANIQISNRTENPVLYNSQELRYDPSKGYRIKSHQKLKLSPPQEIKIEVQFVDNN